MKHFVGMALNKRICFQKYNNLTVYFNGMGLFLGGDIKLSNRLEHSIKTIHDNHTTVGVSLKSSSFLFYTSGPSCSKA